MGPHPTSGAHKRSFAETGLVEDSHQKKHMPLSLGHSASKDTQHKTLPAHHKRSTPGSALVRIARSRTKPCEHAPKEKTLMSQWRAVAETETATATVLTERPLNVPDTSLNRMLSDTTPNANTWAVDAYPEKPKSTGLLENLSLKALAPQAPTPRTVTSSLYLEHGPSSMSLSSPQPATPLLAPQPVTPLYAHSLFAQQHRNSLPEQLQSPLSQRNSIQSAASGSMLPPPLPSKPPSSYKVIPIPVSRRGPGSNRILVRPRPPPASPPLQVANSPALRTPRVSESPTPSACMTPIGNSVIACSGVPPLNLPEALSAGPSRPVRVAAPLAKAEAAKSPGQETENMSGQRSQEGTKTDGHQSAAETPHVPALSMSLSQVHVKCSPVRQQPPPVPRLSRSYHILELADAPAALQCPVPQLSMTPAAAAISLAPARHTSAKSAPRIPPSPTLQAQTRRRATKPIPASLLPGLFDLVIYRQESAAAPPPGVSPLVSQLSAASAALYRRLFSPGHGPRSTGTPLVAWTTPHRPQWYAAKQAQLARNPQNMRKRTNAGARILARRWALEDRLISAPETLGLSNREMAHMELGMRRPRGKKAVMGLRQIEQELPVPPWHSTEDEDWSFVRVGKRQSQNPKTSP